MAYWTDEQKAFLKDLVEGAKYSYVSVTSQLNEKFGTTYSRNAAIGCAMRMGLSNPFQVKTARATDIPRTPRKKVEHRNVIRIARASGNSDNLRVFVGTGSVEPPALRCVPVEPRHLTIVDLEFNDCRQPYGGDVLGDPVTFCGHPKLVYELNGKTVTSSYCGPHHHVNCILPKPPVQKAQKYLGPDFSRRAFA